MFFGKKIQESLLKAMDELFRQAREDQTRQLKELQEQCTLHTEEASQQQQTVLESLTAQLDSQKDQIQEISKRVRRQSESFEDLLEELQTREKEETALEQQLKEKARREESLVALAVCCREQMDLVRHLMEQNTTPDPQGQKAWQEQLAMMDRQVQTAMQACGMEETGCAGDPVDYRLCDVLEAIDTQDPERNGTIATVFRKGRLYCGQVITKAQVAAYRHPQEL